MGRRLGKRTAIRLWGADLILSDWGDAQDELGRWSRYFEELADRSRNTQPAMDEIGQFLLQSTDRNFVLQGRPRRWPPLDPDTIKQRIREGFGAGPILIRTGSLRRGFRYRARARSLEFYNLRFWFPFHQQGRGHNPLRQMFVLLKGVRARITEIMNRYIREG